MERSASVKHSLLARATGASPIAAIGIRGDVDGALHRLGVSPVGCGEARLRQVEAIDEVLVIRPCEDSAILTPHASPVIVDRLLQRLMERGVPLDERTTHIAPLKQNGAPCPIGFHEALMRALSRVASPIGVELLLDQARRWELHAKHGAEPAVSIEERSRRLRVLFEPPLVAVVGASNIGKSTLLNALCRRTASLVADLPGTTRDHVGVLLELDGLVVRWLDLPGLDDMAARDDPVIERAQRLALVAAHNADLVILAFDRDHPGLDFDGVTNSMRVVLRADRGLPTGTGVDFDVAVSVQDPRSIESLAAQVRPRLLPADAVNHPGPWRFWDD